MGDDSESLQVDPYLIQLVLSLEAAAMQQMGKLQNPITGKIERDLDMAKGSIDMLAMVQKKTDGNLTATESNLLKRTLYQLRMNYVEEKNVDQKADVGQQSNETAADDAARENLDQSKESDENKD